MLGAECGQALGQRPRRVFLRNWPAWSAALFLTLQTWDEVVEVATFLSKVDWDPRVRRKIPICFPKPLISDMGNTTITPSGCVGERHWNLVARGAFTHTPSRRTPPTRRSEQSPTPC